VRREKTQTKKYTCIVCPLGCVVKVTARGRKIIRISGCECVRGRKYAEKEHTAPERVLTTTVKVKNGKIPLVPVRTAQPVPKGKMLKCMDELARVEVRAPVKVGDVVADDIAGTGVAVMATRRVEARRRTTPRRRAVGVSRRKS